MSEAAAATRRPATARSFRGGCLGLATAVHIFVNDAGDYYRIADGVPQRIDGEHGVPLPPA